MHYLLFFFCFKDFYNLDKHFFSFDLKQNESLRIKENKIKRGLHYKFIIKIFLKKKLTLMISLIVDQFGEGKCGDGCIKSPPFIAASLEWIGGGRSSLRRSRGSRNCQWCLGEERLTALTRSRTRSRSGPPLAIILSRRRWSDPPPLCAGSEIKQNIFHIYLNRNTIKAIKVLFLIYIQYHFIVKSFKTNR